MNAPVTKPEPLTVRVKSDPPAVCVAGDTNDTDDEDVCRLRFVLNWEQADASIHAATAAISHLREYIRPHPPNPSLHNSG